MESRELRSFWGQVREVGTCFVCLSLFALGASLASAWAGWAWVEWVWAAECGEVEDLLGCGDSAANLFSKKDLYAIASFLLPLFPFSPPV